MTGRMGCWIAAFWLVLASVAVAGAAPQPGCTLLTVAEIPVTVQGSRPVVHAELNGKDVAFLLDTGAFYSMLSTTRAAELGLPVDHLSGGTHVGGVGGGAFLKTGIVRRFRFAGAELGKSEFLVYGGELGGGAEGLIGQNLLGLFDVEYDLGHGVIRLWKNYECKGPLAYWVVKDAAYSVAPLDKPEVRDHIVSPVTLNSVRVRAILDTGAPTTIVDEGAAKRAGVTATDLKGHDVLSGVGGAAGLQGIAAFKTFAISDEEVRNTHVRVGPLNLGREEMLLGLDFFLSHRILVASSQQKLYFTYNGGPVFDLRPLSRAVASQSLGSGAVDAASRGAGAGSTAPSSGLSPATETRIPGETPKDADAYARRGEAEAARGDGTGALADLSRAAILDPGQPDYLRRRAGVHAAMEDWPAAESDFTVFLKARPDDMDGRLGRASVRLALDRRAEALEDVDLAAASPEAPRRRRELGEMYQRLDAFDSAQAQYDLWLAKDPDANRGAAYWTARCRTRALANRDLRRAMSECDRALETVRDDPDALENRGLVRLRLTDWARAVADYNAALKRRSRLPWALYGRGVAKTRLGDKAAGEADIAAAAALAPGLPERAKRLGITP